MIVLCFVLFFLLSFCLTFTWCFVAHTHIFLLLCFTFFFLLLLLRFACVWFCLAESLPLSTFRDAVCCYHFNLAHCFDLNLTLSVSYGCFRNRKKKLIFYCCLNFFSFQSKAWFILDAKSLIGLLFTSSAKKNDICFIFKTLYCTFWNWFEVFLLLIFLCFAKMTHETRKQLELSWDDVKKWYTKRKKRKLRYIFDNNNKNTTNKKNRKFSDVVIATNGNYVFVGVFSLDHLLFAKSSTFCSFDAAKNNNNNGK